MQYDSQRRVDDWNKEQCRRLHRNDPARTWVEIEWTTNPETFLLLGNSLVGNTNCRDVMVEGLFLNEETAKSLARGLSACKMRCLSIHNRIIEIPENAKGDLRRIVFRGIKNSTTLEELSLRTIFLDELHGLNEVLRETPSLRKLCLEQLVLEKTKTTKQLVKAFKALTPTLQCLHIIGHTSEWPDWFGNFPHAGRLLEMFFEGVRRCPTLGELIIEAVPLVQMATWRMIVNAMPALHTLTVCEFVDKPREVNDEDPIETIDPHTAEQYAQLVLEGLQRRSPALSTLHVHTGVFGHDAIVRLSHALRDHSTLTTLKLENIRLDDQGLTLLVDNWGSNSSIQCLSLCRNEIGLDSVQRLMRRVAEHRTMESLNLSDNKFGFDGLRVIGNALPTLSPGFIRLDLSRCVEKGELDNSPAGLNARKNFVAAGHRAALALLTGMQHNFYLDDLALEENYFPEPSMGHAIQFYVSLNVTGRRLLSMNHGLPLTVWCQILAKAARNLPQYEASLIFYFLSEQPTLVPRIDGTSKHKKEEAERADVHSKSSSGGCNIM